MDLLTDSLPSGRRRSIVRKPEPPACDSDTFYTAPDDRPEPSTTRHNLGNTQAFTSPSTKGDRPTPEPSATCAGFSTSFTPSLSHSGGICFPLPPHPFCHPERSRRTCGCFCSNANPPQNLVIPSGAERSGGTPAFRFAVAVVFACPFVCHPAGIFCCSCPSSTQAQIPGAPSSRQSYRR